MKLFCKAVCAFFAGAACAAGAQGDAVAVTALRAGGDATVTRPEGRSSLSVAFKTGDRAAAQVQILKADGARKVLTLQNQTDRLTTKARRDGQTVSESVELPDAKIRFAPYVTRHVRPRLQRYTDEQQQALAARWESLPSASQHRFTLELRQCGEAFALYLDGQYIGREPGAFQALTFKLSAAGEVYAAEAFSRAEDVRYLPLEMRWIARPGIFSNAVATLRPGPQRVDGVPMAVADGAASGDVGKVRQMKGSWALECDEHLARTALDGMPETLHFAVPAAYYTRAWVLCAADPDPKRAPVFSVRMTRYATSGRSEAIGIDTVRLPRAEGEPLPEKASQVGLIALNGTNLPLYLVSLDLKPGALLDLLSMTNDPHASMMQTPYLDVDFMGKPGGIGAQWDTSKKPDKESVSGIHLFGVTLEKMPVSVRLEQRQPGNIFHNGEPPEAVVRARAEVPGAAAVLRWSVLDAEGRVIRSRKKRLAFESAGEEARVVVPLETDGPGYFGLRLAVAGRDGQVWLTHEAAFAQLGDDTRQAGYESPFGTWWFGGAHYGGGELEIGGSMLLKAGLRKTTVRGNKPITEQDLAPWKVTLNAIGWSPPTNVTDKAAAFAELERKAGEKVAQFPHCNAALIFHESYKSYIPPELIGEKPSESEEDVAKGRKRAELANLVAQFYREKYPHIKLLVGNTTCSAALIASLLRHGLRRESIDWIGMEVVGQTSMPEKLWLGGLQGIWLGRETARRMGHDLPVNGCFEFTARTDRNLGQQRQAEFYVRDILISLAYGFERVSPGIIMDAGNAYFNTLWGAGGLCRRYPLLYPKKAYVGVATATRVLDRAAFTRKLDTGSLTVYALAFRRADGREVTALWTTVGSAEVELAFEGVAALEEVGFYGASASRRARRRTIEVGTAPVYLLSDRPVQKATVLERRYAPPPRGFRVADAMATTDAWVLDPDNPALNTNDPELPFRKIGKFRCGPVKDEEKGACLEVALVKEGTLEPLISEYTCLKLKEPLAVDGTPTDIGLWVKGDSGWGKIIFEIEDAKKAVWRTEGQYHDWPGDLSVNFDGWRFMRYPLDGSSDELNLSPGKRWTGGAGTPAFPIRLRGVYVMVNRQALDPTDMRDVPAVLRFKDIGFVYAR